VVGSVDDEPRHRPVVRPAANANSKQKINAKPFLVVAGIGKEPRLGRWISVKGDARNGAMVFAFEPRTPSSIVP